MFWEFRRLDAPVRHNRATTMDGDAQATPRGKRGAEVQLGRRRDMAVNFSSFYFYIFSPLPGRGSKY